MTVRFEGRARRFGDNINTDYIISSTRKRETLNESELRRYLFETVDPGFAATVLPGDIVVADRNFGCGSAMEIAATVLLAAGIRVVLATSFARTFYRNAINNGLLPVECDTSGISEGDRLEISTSATGTEITNSATGRVVSSPALPEIMRQILAAGGLVPWVRAAG